jgi:hypothetical protein
MERLLDLVWCLGKCLYIVLIRPQRAAGRVLQFWVLGARLRAVFRLCASTATLSHHQRRGTLSYLDQLKQALESDRCRVEAKAKLKSADCRISENWEPLTQQIKSHILTLPPALRNTPFLVSQLTSELRGKYHPRPSAGDVGQALRALSYKQRREWSDQGSRRLWYRD